MIEKGFGPGRDGYLYISGRSCQGEFLRHSCIGFEAAKVGICDFIVMRS